MENNTPRPMDMAGDDLLCDELQNKSLKRRNLMTKDKQQSSRWHKAYFCIV
jgi:hypothetical protein